jgi:SAM-dependent methyltransferase
MDNLLFQSEQHPLVADQFSSLEEYCLSLIHSKAYLTVAELAAGKRVLDLGCNHGYGSALIAKSAAAVTGVDVSKAAIIKAREKYPHLDFHVVDGRSLPFESASFDVVASFQVIEHVTDPKPYLKEICRVMRQDGMAIFTTPNRELRLDPGMKPWNPFHVHEFEANELKHLLAQHFGDVRVRGLFAAPELYAVEYRRAREAKHNARGRTWWTDPVLVEARIRRLLRAQFDARGTPEGKLKSWSRFRVEDLFYRDDALDGALDFMAMCTSPERSPPGDPSAAPPPP